MRTRAKKKYVASDRAPRGSHCGGTEFVASRPAAGGESCGAGFYFHVHTDFCLISKRFCNILKLVIFA